MTSTDSLYIDLSERPSAESEEIRDGLVVDCDADGRVVGLDIQNASKTLTIDRLETMGLPLST